MIEVLEGKGVGSGKSYYVTERLLNHFRRGGTAYVSDAFQIQWPECKRFAEKRWGLLLEDDQYHAVSGADIGRLHEVTPPGSEDCPVLIVIDEAQDQLNARDWNDKSKRELFSWCCQSRHDDNDLLFVSQSAANIDKQVRRLATFTWSVRNANNFKFPGLGNVASFIRFATLGLNDGFYFIRTQLDYDGRTVLGREWAKADKGIFGCYVSKSMRANRKRAGAAVKRKQLQRKKGTHPMLKWILLGGIAFALWAVYMLAKSPMFKHQQPPAPTTHGEAHDQRPASVGTPIPYEIEAVTYRGTYGDTLCTVELGNLQVGEMCRRGMVEAVARGRARIRTPKGGLLYVIADREEDLAARGAAAAPGGGSVAWQPPHGTK